MAWQVSQIVWHRSDPQISLTQLITPPLSLRKRLVLWAHQFLLVTANVSLTRSKTHKLLTMKPGGLALRSRNRNYEIQHYIGIVTVRRWMGRCHKWWTPKLSIPRSTKNFSTQDTARWRHKSNKRAITPTQRYSLQNRLRALIQVFKLIA